MARNEVTRAVLEAESAGCGFGEVRHLVSGARGRTVYSSGDPDAGCGRQGWCKV